MSGRDVRLRIDRITLSPGSFDERRFRSELVRRLTNTPDLDRGSAREAVTLAARRAHQEDER